MRAATSGRRMIVSGPGRGEGLRSSAKTRARASTVLRSAFRRVTDQLDIATPGDVLPGARSADIHGAFPVIGRGPELLVGKHGTHAQLERQGEYTHSPQRRVAGPVRVAPVIRDLDRHLVIGQWAGTTGSLDPGSGAVLITRVVPVAQRVKHQRRAVVQLQGEPIPTHLPRA